MGGRGVLRVADVRDDRAGGRRRPPRPRHGDPHHRLRQPAGLAARPRHRARAAARRDRHPRGGRAGRGRRARLRSPGTAALRGADGAGRHRPAPAPGLLRRDRRGALREHRGLLDPLAGVRPDRRARAHRRRRPACDRLDRAREPALDRAGAARARRRRGGSRRARRGRARVDAGAGRPPPARRLLRPRGDGDARLRPRALAPARRLPRDLLPGHDRPRLWGIGGGGPARGDADRLRRLRLRIQDAVVARLPRPAQPAAHADVPVLRHGGGARDDVRAQRARGDRPAHRRDAGRPARRARGDRAPGPRQPPRRRRRPQPDPPLGDPARRGPRRRHGEHRRGRRAELAAGARRRAAPRRRPFGPHRRRRLAALRAGERPARARHRRGLRGRPGRRGPLGAPPEVARRAATR